MSARPTVQTTASTSSRMSRQRSKDTNIELRLRKVLHAMGLRYRVHRRPLSGYRRTADIVFGPARVAVFVDGCFWHGCPEHGTMPKANAAFWSEKIRRNTERDEDTRRALDESGWLAMQVWEHADPVEAATAIAAVVAARRAR